MRKRAAEPARGSAEFCRRIVERSPVPIVILQGETVRFANDAAARMLGRARGPEAVGVNFFDHYPEGHREAAIANARRIQETGRADERVRRWVRTARGTWAEVVGSAVPLFWNGERALLCTAVIVGEHDAAPPGIESGQQTPLPALGVLTDRQRRIALLVVQGFSTLNVASMLNITEATVRTHLKAIFRRLRVGSRVEMTRLLLTQQ